MTCTRSVFSWDIIATKLADGTIFFDKRDNSPFDYLTVHETAYNAPVEDDTINSSSRLSLEATRIGQNFSQQILRKTGRQKMDLPHPFLDEDDEDIKRFNGKMEPASVAYRYRKWQLDDVTLVCRTELHGIVKKSQKMTAFCLNEFIPVPVQQQGPGNTPTPTPSTPTALNWRDKMDSQSGAVLATELKNNSFKLAKWTAQSLLAGADQMRIGFCSRATPKSDRDHVILATQYYRPKDFAQQITLNETQIWAVLRFFLNLVKKQPAGKYVLMRDPNKPIVKLYKVPMDAFDEEEEEEKED